MPAEEEERKGAVGSGRAGGRPMLARGMCAFLFVTAAASLIVEEEELPQVVIRVRIVGVDQSVIAILEVVHRHIVEGRWRLPAAELEDL